MASRASWTRCAGSFGCATTARFALDLAYFRHQREKVEYEWDDGAPVVGALCSPRRSRSCSGPRAAPSRSSPRAPPRHRALGAGDVRGGVLPPAQRRCTRRYRARRARARRRLRDEFGRQRQGLRALRRSGASTCSPRRATPAGRSARRSCAWQRARGRARVAVMDHAYWGPASSDAEIAAALEARDAQIRAGGCRVDALAGRRGGLCAHGRAGDRRRAGGRLVPGPHGMGAARARQSLDRLRSAPRRHEGHPQRKIKRRESFRPFAPSILREAVADWFEDDDDVLS